MRLICLLAGLGLAACAPLGPVTSTTPREAMASPATLSASAIAAALADPARPDADRANDVRRKAAEIVAILQLEPGMRIYDIEAGAGYWTEILSRAVGPRGEVVMQNPQGFIAFVGEQIAARLVNGRLTNVRQYISNFDALGEAETGFDRVLWSQGPHEVFYRPNGVSLGDPEGSARDVARILKPGGLLLVIDHSALPGAPSATGNDLHRIDPAITIGLFTGAGLVLQSQHDLLANPQDPKTASAFDPSIRGRTDQHILLFRKPG